MPKLGRKFVYTAEDLPGLKFYPPEAKTIEQLDAETEMLIAELWALIESSKLT